MLPPCLCPAYISFACTHLISIVSVACQTRFGLPSEVSSCCTSQLIGLHNHSISRLSATLGSHANFNQVRLLP